MVDLINLLAQVSEPITNADAWDRTLTLLFGSSGVITVLALAASHVWKKNADRRFAAEEAHRQLMRDLQKEATDLQKELVEHLKEELKVSKKVARAHGRALTAVRKSTDENTRVLRLVESTTKDVGEVSKDTREILKTAVNDPTRLPVPCKYPGHPQTG